MDKKERGRSISISKKGMKYTKHKENPTSFKKGIEPESVKFSGDK